MIKIIYTLALTIILVLVFQFDVLKIKIFIMSKKVKGSFYLKQTVNGNLLGEFSNNQSIEIYKESADIKGSNTSPYIGNYDSKWFVDGIEYSAALSIKHKTSANKRLFNLEWVGVNILFIGEGLLIDDLLIGNYHD